MSGGTQGSRGSAGQSPAPTWDPAQGTEREAEVGAPSLPRRDRGLSPSRSRHRLPRPPSSARLLVPTPYLSTANQSRTSVLGPVKWSHSTHLAASRSREMQILSSLCVVPSGGAGRAAQASPYTTP